MRPRTVRIALSWPYLLCAGGGHSPKQLILYFAIKSSWSSAARLTLEEKGLQTDMRVLNLFKQEHLTVIFHILDDETEICSLTLVFVLQG